MSRIGNLTWTCSGIWVQLISETKVMMFEMNLMNVQESQPSDSSIFRLCKLLTLGLSSQITPVGCWFWGELEWSSPGRGWSFSPPPKGRWKWGTVYSIYPQILYFATILPNKIATSWYMSNFWANPNYIDMVAVSHCIPMISSFMVYLWFIFITINHHKPMPNATSCTCGVQGQAAHVERYRSSPIMHSSVPDECKSGDPMLWQLLKAQNMTQGDSGVQCLMKQEDISKINFFV